MGKSELEELLLMQIRDAGLPEPRRNVRKGFVMGLKGRWLEADFLWKFSEDDTCFRGVAVEVQGGLWMPPARDRQGIMRGRGHANPKRIEDDCTKMCLAQLDSWLLLPVTKKMIDDGRALEWIREALALA